MPRGVTGPQRLRDESLAMFGYTGRPVLTTQEVEQAFIAKCQASLCTDLTLDTPLPREKRWTNHDYICLLGAVRPETTTEQYQLFREILSARSSCIEYVERKGWLQKTPPAQRGRVGIRESR